MNVIEIMKAVVFGIVEGVTEWLPISSTGHMILLDEFIHLDVSPEFMEMFLVVIQLGAIFAVVLLYWNKIFPFVYKAQQGIRLKQGVLSLWSKILVACIPAAVIGLLFDDVLNAWFYNYQTVTISLIIFGIALIVIEKVNNNKQVRVTSLGMVSYKDALLVGLFQIIAAIFPGTSRSGATILGGMMVGLSRIVATRVYLCFGNTSNARCQFVKTSEIWFSFFITRTHYFRYRNVLCVCGFNFCNHLLTFISQKKRF